MELKNSIALVTGGASGLGQATVEEFVSKGAKVVILDINEDNAKKIIDKQDQFGWWPNDAIMCRQLCSWIRVYKPYFTRTQGITSTTSK